ncbi:MAG: hypothetical protein MJE77_41100 [Proteobacteria bacterium]|nr:hypothetical protein [Pseudomonadota bacterium]
MGRKRALQLLEYPRRRAASGICATLFVVCLVATGAGCGGRGQPPHGPVYRPVNSPEADTPCTETWLAAKRAREALLERSDAQARLAAARAVFEQAECERHHFDEQSIAAATEVATLDNIRAARAQYHNARNLFAEVIAYREVAMLRAQARLGDLHLAFATKLRRLVPPADIADPAEKALFRAELAELADQFDHEAMLAYTAALDNAALVQSPHSAGDSGWIPQTCQKLARIEPALRHSLCTP